MKFSDEKKNSIKQYLLEKITSNDSSPTKTVAETCNQSFHGSLVY